MEKPQNSAAWLMGKKVKPLKIAPAPYTSPHAGQIVVKNHALAINPVDRMKQELGDLLLGWVKYPAILGCDLAGEVVEAGPGVTQFKSGDRVLALALGGEKERNKAAEGAFQNYTVILENVATKIPDTLSFEEASVLPLCFCTAACALFEKKQLALPQRPSSNPQTTKQTVIVWGASTSVGCNAVQLAVAAGYEVIAVCGARNFELVKGLGASEVFDYKSSTISKDLRTAFGSRISAGCVSCGNGGPEAWLDVAAVIKGSKKIAFVAFPLPEITPGSTFFIPRFLWFMSTWWTSWIIRSTLRSVKRTSVWGSTPAWSDLSGELYNEYLPTALAQGSFKAAPQPEVLGTGLELVQQAYDLLGKGVSAKKYVVKL